jgi:hypothetical protein
MDQAFRKHIDNTLRIGLVAGMALTAAACASTPLAPSSALQSAQQAIASAERIDAGHHAPGELADARSKLAEATVAIKDEKMIVAEHLALQARASADLAAAKTASKKARAENAEIVSGNAALVEELNRNSGASK